MVSRNTDKIVFIRKLQSEDPRNLWSVREHTYKIIGW